MICSFCFNTCTVAKPICIMIASIVFCEQLKHCKSRVFPRVQEISKFTRNLAEAEVEDHLVAEDHRLLEWEAAITVRRQTPGSCRHLPTSLHPFVLPWASWVP